jgi:predicted Holliday junction resolvase-like endonuclease
MDQVLPLLLLLTVLVLAYLLYLYFTLKSTFEPRLRALFEQWKERELQELRRQCEVLSQKSAALQLSQWIQEHESAIRKDAIKRSRAMMGGAVTEQVAPLLPDFHHNPKDVRFLGTPVAFVVFDGLDAGAVEKITFITVTTEASSPWRREGQIRDAISRGAVAWEELRLHSSRAVSNGTPLPEVSSRVGDHTCSRCQRKNRAHAAFCGYCGNALELRL